MTIQEGELLKCNNCESEFRWIPRNSTIKPKICPRCQKLKDFENKRKYNQKMLSRSTLVRYNKRTDQKPGKYTPKNKSGLKRKKTAKDRFYKSAAWKWFSRYILISSSIDVTGTTVQCCTCGKWMNVTSRDCHVGHYVKVFDGNSTNYSTAFVEANTAPQCSQCNRYNGGRQDEMAVFIDKKHGEGTVTWLMELKRLPLKLDGAYLEEIKETYKEKFKNCLEQRGINDPWKKK
jgi:hypothetical protein